MPAPAPALLLYEIAALEAQAAQSGTIDTAHLLVAAAKLPDFDLADALGPDAPNVLKQAVVRDAERIGQAFERAQLDPKAFRRRLRFEVHRAAKANAENKNDDGVLHRTPEARRAFDRAQEFAQAESSPLLSLHVLRAALERPQSPWREVLEEMGVGEPLTAFFADEATDAASSTPALDHFGRDLTALARAGQLAPVVARRDEIVRLGQILTSARKGNALLIGAPGVGKTAVVEGLAQRLSAPGLPPSLEGRRLIEMPLAALLAGASYRGEWEARLQSVLQEAEDCGAILFFDEVHTLLGAGGQGASDAANLLKPLLARGAVRVIGATTPEEYARTIERDAALDRRFETVWIEEPNREAALTILRGLQPRLEAHHGVRFEADALEAALEMSIRFLPDLKLPDKALDALDGAASAARLGTLSFRAGADSIPALGRAEVAAAIARRARVPLEQVLQSDAQRLLQLEDDLKTRVVGQDAAIATVADALKLSFSGFKQDGKPHGVFLFAGASGAGKTELAKALAQSLYGDEKSLLRFDMSEYGESHTVARLLGAPPGYIGHDEGGQLSRAVRERPASVVLFDEIEKAHPDVWNIWLQLFDEGHVTDARGRRVDFSETVIALTSNLGSGVVKSAPIGLRAAPSAQNEFRDGVLRAIQKALRPELLGRIGEVLIFEPLSPEAVRRVAEIALSQVAANANKRGVSLNWDESVLALLAREGFDEREGARAMRKTVERLVARPLAETLLRGDLKPVQAGQTLPVRALMRDEAVVFEPEAVKKTRKAKEAPDAR